MPCFRDFGAAGGAGSHPAYTRRYIGKVDNFPAGMSTHRIVARGMRGQGSAISFRAGERRSCYIARVTRDVLLHASQFRGRWNRQPPLGGETKEREERLQKITIREVRTR